MNKFLLKLRIGHTYKIIYVSASLNVFIYEKISIKTDYFYFVKIKSALD